MSKTCDASPMDNNIQFDLRELIRAAEMSGINPQQIPGDANPWTWEDSRAMSWRSNFRALNPAVAQQAETLLGGPLSLALQAAMDAGETLSVDLDRELKIRRSALHEQLRQRELEEQKQVWLTERLRCGELYFGLSDNPKRLKQCQAEVDAKFPEYSK